MSIADIDQAATVTTFRKVATLRKLFRALPKPAHKSWADTYPVIVAVSATGDVAFTGANIDRITRASTGDAASEPLPGDAVATVTYAGIASALAMLGTGGTVVTCDGTDVMLGGVTVARHTFTDKHPGVTVDQLWPMTALLVMQAAGTASFPASGVHHTYRATSKVDTMPLFTGVRCEWHSTGDGFASGDIAATDRFRLHVQPAETYPRDTISGEAAMVVPGEYFAATVAGKTGSVKVERLTDIGNVLPHFAARLTYDLTDARGRRIMSIVTAGRVLDGNYPKFRDLIPGGERPTVLEVDARQLSEAVQAVGKLGKATGQPRAAAVLDITPEGVAVSLNFDSDTPTGVTAEPIRIAGTLTGAPLRVGVNPAFTVDALAGWDSTVAMTFGEDPTRPLVVSDATEYRVNLGSRRLALLMPVKLP